jgi:LysR family hydrogen peroxide-inducible transcriptional activator
MDLRQLNALVAVADHGSFSAAADALHTVQSNVSTHVARLERELGALLVDRNGGTLTEEGVAVVERARRIRGELDALVADVAAMHDVVVGTVRIGMIGTTARWLAPRLVESLTERHPKIRLIIVDATSTSLEPQLASGRLDLAIVNLPVPGPDFVTYPLFEEDLVLIMPADHPLARRDSVAVGDLDGLELLLPAPGTSLRDELDQCIAAAGIKVTPRAELDGVTLMASLAFDGHGPAVLPATAVPSRFGGEWTRLAIRDLPRRGVGVAQRRKGLPAAPVRAVLVVLDEVVAAGMAERTDIHVPGDG